MKIQALLVLCTVLALVTGAQGITVPASIEETLPDPGTLPGHWEYMFKQISESITNTFMFNDADKAERHLELAELRLSEANALLAKGRGEDAEWAMVASEEHYSMAYQNMNRVRERNRNTTQLEEQVQNRTQHLKQVFKYVLERAPEESRTSLMLALNKATGETAEDTNGKSNGLTTVLMSPNQFAGSPAGYGKETNGIPDQAPGNPFEYGDSP